MKPIERENSNPHARNFSNLFYFLSMFSKSHILVVLKVCSLPYQYTGGYLEDTGGCLVHQRDDIMNLGNIIETASDFQYSMASIESEMFCQ